LLATISVIIPTWREAAEIGSAIASAQAEADEVIVADGGSDDRTVELARAAGALAIVAQRSRGIQLHAGAQAAQGDVLVFLHADTRLPPGWREAILRALEAPSICGGNFFLVFEGNGRLARFYTWLYDLRRRWMGIYYGDSAVFVRRTVYRALGGYRPIPILEDYDFIRRLERSGKTAYLRDSKVSTSTRRFTPAPVRTMLTWILIQGLYFLGVSPGRLRSFYSGKSARTEEEKNG
jgi:rSAM/selenodomain-associated transferase 2